MQRTCDQGICPCASLCAGKGEGGLADYGHMTMYSIGSLGGQVLCIHCTVDYDIADCLGSGGGGGWGVGVEGGWWGVGAGGGGRGEIFNEDSAGVIHYNQRRSA
jgi:hypothetical protein